MNLFSWPHCCDQALASFCIYTLIIIVGPEIRWIWRFANWLANLQNSPLYKICWMIITGIFIGTFATSVFLFFHGSYFRFRNLLTTLLVQLELILHLATLMSVRYRMALGIVLSIFSLQALNITQLWTRMN